jgi:hypothetical protein
VLLVAVTLAACSGDDGDSATTDERSTDFTVEVPEGYHLLAEGTGRGDFEWGDDSSGNTGPFVVLGGSDDPIGQMTTFELGGFAGMQGGLGQAAGYCCGVDNIRTFEVDGRPAEAFSTATFTSVAAERGDDIGTIVRSTVLSRDDLVALIESADLPDGEQPRDPPEVEPPGGWAVLGEASADLTMALEAYADEGFIGGPPSAHGRAWRASDSDNRLIVLDLPESAGDVGAVLGFSLVTGGIAADEVERFELDGREAAWVANESHAALATTTEWGDLLLVLWQPNGTRSQPPDRDLLETVATSAEEA